MVKGDRKRQILWQNREIYKILWMRNSNKSLNPFFFLTPLTVFVWKKISCYLLCFIAAIFINSRQIVLGWFRITCNNFFCATEHCHYMNSTDLETHSKPWVSMTQLSYSSCTTHHLSDITHIIIYAGELLKVTLCLHAAASHVKVLSGKGGKKIWKIVDWLMRKANLIPMESFFRQSVSMSLSTSQQRVRTWDDPSQGVYQWGLILHVLLRIFWAIDNLFLYWCFERMFWNFSAKKFFKFFLWKNF